MPVPLCGDRHQDVRSSIYQGDDLVELLQQGGRDLWIDGGSGAAEDRLVDQDGEATLHSPAQVLAMRVRPGADNQGIEIVLIDERVQPGDNRRR